MEEHGKFNGQPNQMKEVFVEFRAYLAVGLLFVFRCRQANPYCAQDVIVQPVLFVTSKKITTFAAIIINNFRMRE